MNPNNDRHRLLDAVMAGEEHDDFRQALLNETLIHARRRRVVRRCRKAGAAVAVLALGVLLAWLPMRSVFVPAAPRGGYVGIQTQTVPTVSVINTRAFGADNRLASMASVEIVTTTTFSGRFRTVSDDELLAMVAPYPAALVRIGPNAERLMFLNPGDELIFQQ